MLHARIPPPPNVARLALALAHWLLAAGTACAGQAPDTAVPRHTEAVARHLAFESTHVALVGVTLIDGSGRPPIPDQTIVFDDGTITRIGDAATTEVPAGARQLRLPGRTVIPGIVGMHNHTHMPGQPLMPHTAPRLYLAAGVTTIATAGSADAEGEIALARAIEAGALPGPRILPSAPYVSGPGGNGPMDKPASPAAARAFVRTWAARGARWVKLYRHVEPRIAAAVIDEAHALGLKVTGHLCSLRFREAALMGIDSIEHGLISATDLVPGKAPGECVSNRAALSSLDPGDSEVQELIALLVRERVTLTSTLAIIETHFAHRPQADARILAMLSPARVEAYHARQRRLAASAGSGPFQPALFQALLAFERRFVAAGGKLVAGPDTGRHVLPGFGDQRNFELLVEAGFAAADAVRILSANGAEALGLDHEVGTLRPGMQADLVVLRGDLARDPHAIRSPELVVRAGVAFDPASLLEEARGQVGLR